MEWGDSIWSIFSAGPGPVSSGVGVNYEDCYDQVVTICSRASRDNYHKPRGPSTDQNTIIVLWILMIYSLPLLSFLIEFDFTQVDIYFRCYRIECQRCCCSSPRPNWRSPGPPQPGSPCYLCSKFLHKIVIGPRDPNKTINTQLVTRLTLASSPHSLLALSMSGQLTHADVCFSSSDSGLLKSTQWGRLQWKWRDICDSN